ncbi:MAG: HEAT repeat domain-containing protein [bacterium]
MLIATVLFFAAQIGFAGESGGAYSWQDSLSVLPGVALPLGDFGEINKQAAGGGIEWSHYYPEKNWTFVLSGMHYPGFKPKKPTAASGSSPPSPLPNPLKTAYGAYNYSESGYEGNASAGTIMANARFTTSEKPVRFFFDGGLGVARFRTSAYASQNKNLFFSTTYYDVANGDHYGNWEDYGMNVSVPGVSKIHFAVNAGAGLMLAAAENLRLGIEGRFTNVYVQGGSLSYFTPSARLAYHFGKVSKTEAEAERENKQAEKHPDDIQALVDNLKNENWQVRRKAAFELEKIHDKRTVGLLIGALQDEDDRVCETAALVLGWIGDRRAFQPLVEALEDFSPYVRSSAAKGLGYLRDKRAVKPLKKALNDENDAVRKAVSQALKKFRR